MRKPMEYRLFIKQIDETWTVVDEEGQAVTLKVSPGDTVVWMAGESDAFFQFPVRELFAELVKENTWTPSLPSGQSLRLTVGERAPEGAFVYAVFNTKDDRYARGGSPPKMIIMR